jgi:UDP-N-acetylglucosamine acyltransferase
MHASVHPTAVVERGAELGDGAKVGPFCYLGAGVRIGDGTELVAQVTVLGPTRIGSGCRLFPFAAVGLPPQDRSWSGEATGLVVGDDCVLREHVTVHRGTEKGGGLTRIGSRCLLMVGTHVAHDCVLGDDLVLSNLTTLGGHVTVDANVVTGGQVAVAPFVRLWRGCFLAGGAKVERDVPPFMIAAGDRARIRGVNLVGLRRMGVGPASRKALVQAYRKLWRSELPLTAALTVVERELGGDPYIAELAEALHRSVSRPATPSRRPTPSRPV